MFNLKTQHSQQDSQSNVKGVLCAIARHKCIQGDTNSVLSINISCMILTRYWIV